MGKYILLQHAFNKEKLSQKPDFDSLKKLIIDTYNNENLTNYEFGKINISDQELIIKWYYDRMKDGFITFSNYTPITVVPFFSPSLSLKISNFSQFHCPLCSAENQFPIMQIPIRISAISKQSISKKSKLRKAFEKAISSKFDKNKIEFKKGEKLCLLIVFILGKSKRNKDLDNMAKALIDGLEKNLFEDDMDIDHLNLIKIRTDEDEDYININIRRTDLNKHKDVLFPIMSHSWGNIDFLDLRNFLDN